MYIILVVDPRFDIHEVVDGIENEIRNETGSSILDDTSTIAGSVLYAGGSDTSTLAGEIQMNTELSDDDIQVNEVMKHFDDTINHHYDEAEQSIELVSANYVSDKNTEQERTTKNILESCSDNRNLTQNPLGQCDYKV